MLNILDKLPRNWQAEAKALLRAIPYAETQEAASAAKQMFQTWCAKKGLPAIGQALNTDWERLVAFFEFPKAHWKRLRTTNPIESPFAAVRLRPGAAKRFKKVDHATALIWKTLLIAEKTFRRLECAGAPGGGGRGGAVRQWRARQEGEREGRRLRLFTDLLTRALAASARRLAT